MAIEWGNCLVVFNDFVGLVILKGTTDLKEIAEKVKESLKGIENGASSDNLNSLKQVLKQLLDLLIACLECADEEVFNLIPSIAYELKNLISRNELPVKSDWISKLYSFYADHNSSVREGFKKPPVLIFEHGKAGELFRVSNDVSLHESVTSNATILLKKDSLMLKHAVSTKRFFQILQQSDGNTLKLDTRIREQKELKQLAYPSGLIFTAATIKEMEVNYYALEKRYGAVEISFPLSSILGSANFRFLAAGLREYKTEHCMTILVVNDNDDNDKRDWLTIHQKLMAGKKRLKANARPIGLARLHKLEEITDLDSFKFDVIIEKGRNNFTQIDFAFPEDICIPIDKCEIEIVDKHLCLGKNFQFCNDCTSNGTKEKRDWRNEKVTIDEARQNLRNLLDANSSASDKLKEWMENCKILKGESENVFPSKTAIQKNPAQKKSRK